MLEIAVDDLTDVRLWLFVLMVTVIGLAEKYAIYRAGQLGAETDIPDAMGYSPERRARIKTMLETRGTYILLLASIPGIGAATAAIAGSVGVAIPVFVFWVTISNLVRNWLIVILAGQLAAFF
jgi:membrane protein YqaA with SNARE-associated domain